MELGAPELVVVLVIVVVVFGPSKLPQLARSIGEAVRELREGSADPGPLDDPPG